MVGGRLGVLGSGARLGKGEYLVAEADESDRSFLKLSPTLAVVTNIDREHLDAYRDLADIQEAFLGFVNKVPFYGCAVVCLDDPPVAGDPAAGRAPRGDLRPLAAGERLGARPRAQSHGLELHRGLQRPAARAVTVEVPGAHNVTNSLAAVAVGLDLELPFEAIRQGLASFTGVDRRFQVRGEAGGVLVIDDYGHHPTEIRATLETLRRRAGARRTLVLFQPHRFTRTQALWDDFCSAFGDADVLRLVDVYPASEDPIEGVTSEALARAIAKRGHPDAAWVGDLRAAGERLAREAVRGRRGADARRRQRVDGGRRAAAEARGMTRRGLPVGPPPEELMDLPLDPSAEESPFLRPRGRPACGRGGAASRRARCSWCRSPRWACVGVVGAWSAWQRVFASDRLRVGRLEVRGSHFLSEGEVRELASPAVGESILTLDIEALKARLRSSPWVADATVTRALPDTVRVEIHERVPLALAELDRLYLMDQDGDLIDIYGPRTGAFDLPIVRGLMGVEEDSRRDRARRAGTLLADLADLGERDLRGVRRALRRPARGPARGRRGAAVRGAALPGAARDVPEPAQGARAESPGAEHFDLRFRGRIFAKQTKPVTTPSEPGATPSHPAAEHKKPVAPSAGATAHLPEKRT